MDKILIIQTAYIGDVILATSIIEELSRKFPNAHLDFLVRKGNETILENNPHLNHVLFWNKQGKKYKEFFKILRIIRNINYDLIINIHRFASSGFLTAFSNAKTKIGYKNKPWDIFYSKTVKHYIHPFAEVHEVERLFHLIHFYTTSKYSKPRLYPYKADYEAIKKYQTDSYICIAPTSVWKTKEFPMEKWTDFVDKVNRSIKIFLLGAKTDHQKCEAILNKSINPNIENLAGKLSILESAALMQKAKMNFVNDSAPLHICSAMNAPVAALFCSTVPGFGFGPLSENATVIEIDYLLGCRPCGIHGKNICPEKHFNCGNNIEVSKMLDLLSYTN